MKNRCVFSVFSTTFERLFNRRSSAVELLCLFGFLVVFILEEFYCARSFFDRGSFVFAFVSFDVDVLRFAEPNDVGTLLFLGIILIGLVVARRLAFFAAGFVGATVPIVAVVVGKESIFAVASSILFGFEKFAFGKASRQTHEKISVLASVCVDESPLGICVSRD